MKISSIMILCSLGLLVSACGGDANVSLKGKSATEQANTIVETLCNQAVECGTISMECAAFGDEPAQCTASLSTISDEECSEDLSEDMQFQASCWTDQGDEALLALAESCINAMAAIPCITDEELQTYVAAMNAGEEPDDLRPMPEVCEQFHNHEVMQSCGDSE